MTIQRLYADRIADRGVGDILRVKLFALCSIHLQLRTILYMWTHNKDEKYTGGVWDTHIYSI